MAAEDINKTKAKVEETNRQREERAAVARQKELMLKEFVEEPIENLKEDFDKWLEKSAKRNEQMVFRGKPAWDMLSEFVNKYKAAILLSIAILAVATGVGSIGVLAVFGASMLPVVLPYLAIAATVATAAVFNAIGNVKLFGRNINFGNVTAKASMAVAGVGVVLATAVALSIPFTWPVIAGAVVAGAVGYLAGDKIDQYILQPIAKGLKGLFKSASHGVDQLRLMSKDPLKYTKQKPRTVGTTIMVGGAAVTMAAPVFGAVSVVTGASTLGVVAAGAITVVVAGKVMQIGLSKAFELDEMTDAEREKFFEAIKAYVPVDKIDDLYVKSVRRIMTDLESVMAAVKNPAQATRDYVKAVRREPGREIPKLLTAIAGAAAGYSAAVTATAALTGVTAAILPIFAAYGAMHISRKLVETLILDKVFPRDNLRNLLFNGEMPKDISVDKIKEAIALHLPKMRAEHKDLAKEAAELADQIVVQKAHEAVLATKISTDKESIAEKQEALQAVLIKARASVEKPGPAKEHSREQNVKLIEILEQSKELQQSHKQSYQNLTEEATNYLKEHNKGLSSWFSLEAWAFSFNTGIVPSGGVAQMQQDLTLIAQAWSKLDKTEQETFAKEHKGSLLDEVAQYEKTEKNWIENSVLTPELKARALQDLDDSTKLWRAWINKDADYIKEVNAAGSEFDIEALEKIWGATKMTQYYINNQMHHRAHSAWFSTLDDMEDGLADIPEEDLQEYCQLEKDLCELETRVFNMEGELGKAATMERRLEIVKEKQAVVATKVGKVEDIEKMIPKIAAKIDELEKTVKDEGADEQLEDSLLGIHKQNTLLNQQKLSQEKANDKTAEVEPAATPKVRQSSTPAKGG